MLSTVWISGGFVFFAVVIRLFYQHSPSIIHILMGLLREETINKNAWRINLILGLILGGALYQWQWDALINTRETFPIILSVISGLLMGAGVQFSSQEIGGQALCYIPEGAGRAWLAVGIIVLTAIGVNQLFYV